MKNNTVTVYWSPHTSPNVAEVGDWNMMYKDPYRLLDYFSELTYKDQKKDSYVSCPAFQSISKNTFVFENLVQSEYNYRSNGGDQNQIAFEPTSKTFLAPSVSRNQMNSIGPTVELGMRYMFFAEEDLKLTLTPPYLHQVEYMKYGTLASGEFDCGQWFRPVNIELQMFNESGNLVINKDEPLMYIRFLTDKRVELKRFTLNKALYEYGKSCVNAKGFMGYKQPLPKLYEMFKSTRTRDIVLQEIKKNLI